MGIQYAFQRHMCMQCARSTNFPERCPLLFLKKILSNTTLTPADPCNPTLCVCRGQSISIASPCLPIFITFQGLSDQYARIPH